MIWMWRLGGGSSPAARHSKRESDSIIQTLVRMLFYEVNLTVTSDIINEYASWLRSHVREMLELDGFEAAAWYERSDDAETIPDGDDVQGTRLWTLHYQVRDREALQAYFDDHAEAMRQAGAKYADDVEVDRRILQQRTVFQSKRGEDTGPM